MSEPILFKRRIAFRAQWDVRTSKCEVCGVKEEYQPKDVVAEPWVHKIGGGLAHFEFYRRCQTCTAKTEIPNPLELTWFEKVKMFVNDNL